MYIKEDTTFNDIRERAIRQWLDEISENEDVAVRGGVKVTREYLDTLKKQIAMLEEKNALKDKYLKQLKERKG